MRGESARRAVTRGEDLLTGRDRVDGDRYQVDTVGGVKDGWTGGQKDNWQGEG